MLREEKGTPVKRIAIIGSPGAGKSTFARRLGEITGIEVFHLDRLFWKPGWVATPRSDWIALQQRLVQNESWIIDGNYGATMDIRIQAADTVIFLDFPRRVCLWRVAKRVYRYRGQTRPDMAEGCPEKIDLEFFRYIWGFRKREQEKILQRLEEAQRQGKRVVRLVTSEQVEEYLGSIRCIWSEPTEATC
jgi:adenylate kinase family enzyme